MKKQVFLTVVFSFLLNVVLYSQVAFKNGSFEDPDNDVKYTASGTGGGGPTKMENNLTGWWADAFATDCGREAPREVGKIPDGKYVGFAFNNDGGVIWNLSGTVEPGMRNLLLTFYVQESWPQNLTDMSVVIKFAIYEGDDPSVFEVVDSLSQPWDKANADENGFVLYEFLEELPAYTEGKNLLIGFDIAHVNDGGTWVNFDNFQLEVSKATGISKTALKNTTVYPNPAKDFITIESSTNNTIEYSLTNLTGKEVLVGSVANNDKIDVSSLRKGIYFLNIKNSLGAEAVKTVIKK